jgi:O-antigen biosynthesis protein
MRRALVAAPLLPEYDRESGGQSIWDFVMFLREEGWAVSFASENPLAGERYARLLRQRGVAVYRGFGERLDEALAYGGFELAVCAFWYVGERLIPRLRALSPNTCIVVNTMDLHFLRAARRQLAAGRGRPLDADYGSDAARELNVYAAADAVFAVSRKEAQLVGDFVGDSGLAHVVGDNEEASLGGAAFAQRSGMVFIGNYRHPPNVEAVEFLCREIAPRIDPALLDEHPIYLVGNELPADLAAYAATRRGVKVVGWVPAIAPYLERSRLSIVPLRHGAGTKRKVLQALAAGTPTITTSVGAEGLDVRHGEHILVADDPSDFAAHVSRLLVDEPLWLRLAAAGKDFVRGGYGRDDARKGFLAAVERVLERPPKKPTDALEPLVRVNGVARPLYRDLVARVREEIRAAVPDGSTVAVVSRGDDELVDLEGLVGWHFPRAANGVYAGFYPRDGRAAVEQLEAVRAAGADYLAFPQTAFWWLDHYPELAEHLRRNGDQILDREDACLVYRLN